MAEKKSFQMETTEFNKKIETKPDATAAAQWNHINIFITLKAFVVRIHSIEK